MPDGLDIALAPERLDEGTPEERAAFGMLTVRTPHGSLTEGFDWYVNSLREGPLVSGYHAAEWLAWNWWRLRWQPRSASPDWEVAHGMISIGEGYVWPNLTIFSDGVRTTLISKPSSRPDARPFRYLGAMPTVIPSTTFEAAVDAFIIRILNRLREEGVGETNLDRVWADVLAERGDRDLARRRRLEALLGFDVGEVDDATVDRMLADSAVLGDGATDEVAADLAQGRGSRASLLTADDFQRAAEGGFQASPQDAANIAALRRLPRNAQTPAWKLGTQAARALREQERLGVAPIANVRLAEIAGTSVDGLIHKPTVANTMSFELNSNARSSRIVLRSRWEVGRRFDLSRLIFDRALSAGGALHPATRADTYRQKAQRSFAAEFLSPFEAVDEMLDGDYSSEFQEEVAEHFNVSPRMIDTLLKNHGRIDRDDDYGDSMAA